ncbi:MAG: outer membrane protein OmpA-like peptidoglycan-associated protein [Myxococcota bacterium]|jgi:outer membrane protein OmpA-like peptidoglycan-associated protein
MLSFFCLWTSLALAEDAFTLEVVQVAQQGTGLPRLSVLVNSDLSALSIDLRCGSLPVTAGGAPSAGERLDVDIPLPSPGTASCTGSLAATFTDGSHGTMPLQFDATLLAPIEVTADREQLDLQAHALVVALSRPAARVTVEASGLDGILGEGSVDVTGLPAGEPISISWSQPDGAEVLQLRLRAEDAEGFWAALDLFPWSYAIPHEDVVFASGAAEVRTTEAPKLTEAMSEISAVEAKYGQLAQVNLYVAGYTDTVGGGAVNRALSERRARAIAAWFRAAGFTGAIFYQGFGEEGLLVETGDEVDEPRNRRAAYIVAAEAPPPSPAMPGARWSRLP